MKVNRLLHLMVQAIVVEVRRIFTHTNNNGTLAAGNFEKNPQG